MYTLHTRFCTFRADLYAQSVLINEISASELSRKFIKSALLAGQSRNRLSEKSTLSPKVYTTSKYRSLTVSGILSRVGRKEGRKEKKKKKRVLIC